MECEPKSCCCGCSVETGTKLLLLFDAVSFHISYFKTFLLLQFLTEWKVFYYVFIQDVINYKQ